MRNIAKLTVLLLGHVKLPDSLNLVTENFGKAGPLYSREVPTG